ncbi:MAG: 5'-nucleotidase C-terminal domain-containing protein [Pseudomonadota bacterium]
MLTRLIKRPQGEYVFKRGFLIFLVLTGLMLTFSCGLNQKGYAGKETPVHHLVVLHTNDTHGHPVRFSYHPAIDVGGLPARATLINKIRKENRNVLVLDAGDLNTGRPESNLFKAEPDIKGYNTIGYDAMVLGNHEFDNPVSILKKQMTWAHFPFLSANIRTKNGELLARPYIIKSFDGFKVAILGLTTKGTEITGNPEHIKDLLFEDEIDVAKKLVPELKKKADLVLALVHMGLYESFHKGSKRLASKVKGIDLIIDGHTHTRLDSPVIVETPQSGHKTLIVQAWQWGLVVGRVDLWIKNKKVINYEFKTIPVNLRTVKDHSSGAPLYHLTGEPIREDASLLALLQPYVDKVESALSEVIGYAKETFSIKDMRNKETALGDMIADSMLWTTQNLGVDFAIQNGGGVRASLPSGKITKRLIHEILPFDNSVVVLTLKGTDIQSFFDYIGTLQEGRGAFPQVSEGLRFKINRLKGRCEDIFIKGRPIDPDRVYKLATNSYLANGGDGYKMLLNALEKYDSSKFQRDVFIEYIKFLGGHIRPQIKGRITLITNQETTLLLRHAA